MTAPVVPQVPTAPPAGDVATNLRHNPSAVEGDALLSWIGVPAEPAPTPAPAAETPAPPSGLPRDPDTGRFVSRDGAEAPPVETPPAEAPPAPDTPPAEPDQPPTDAPLTAFRLRDKEGELNPESVRGIEVTYTVDGKERTVPFEKVVHLAQQSTFFGQQVSKLGQERVQAQGEAERFRLEAERLQHTLEEAGLAYAAVLADPDKYEAAAEAYRQSQTPEAQLERLRRDREADQQRAASAVEQQALQNFGTQVVGPMFERLVQQYPSVDFDALYGRYAMEVPTWLNPATGRVPVDRLPALAQHLEATLAQYAKGLHARRASADHEHQSTLARERQSLVATKREVARALAPAAASTSPSGAPAAPRPIPIVRARDAVSDDYVRGIIAEASAGR